MPEFHCASCAKTKPASDFNKNRARSTGHDNYCRDCMRQRERNRVAARRKHLDEVPTERQCTIHECTDRVKGLGYCNRHLKRFRAYGDPLVAKRQRKAVSSKPPRPSGMTLTEAFQYFMPGPPPEAGELWMWTGSLDENGYGTLRHGGRNHAAHRLAYEIFVGPIPEGLHIRHKNDTPQDVNPNNLEVGTRQDNVQDREERDRTHRGPQSPEGLARHARGERSGMAKLTIEVVQEIRRRHAGGESQQNIADSIGISQRNVSNIVRRKTWAHIP